MTTEHLPNSYPGTFNERCELMEAEARAKGVCPKIFLRQVGRHQACGRPLVEGGPWCLRHQYGV